MSCDAQNSPTTKDNLASKALQMKACATLGLGLKSKDAKALQWELVKMQIGIQCGGQWQDLEIL